MIQERKSESAASVVRTEAFHYKIGISLSLFLSLQASKAAAKD